MIKILLPIVLKSIECLNIQINSGNNWLIKFILCLKSKQKWRITGYLKKKLSSEEVDKWSSENSFLPPIVHLLQGVDKCGKGQGVTPVVPSHICPHPGGGGLLEGGSYFPNSICPLPPMRVFFFKYTVILHFCLLFSHKMNLISQLFPLFFCMLRHSIDFKTIGKRILVKVYSNTVL